MSKNIIIQEGGTAKQMTVNKLKTDKVGGGTCLWVPEEEVSLGTKSISANGTYKASDDGKYGFSQVTVNVAGAPGSADSSGKPISSDGEPTIGSTIIGTDPTDGETYEYSVAPNGDVTKTLVSTITPGGPGSGVVGTDPEDGNEYFIGIDENGTIVKTKIPSGIEIGRAPNKTNYTEGEAIDYSGIIVILKGGDSAVFSNTKYPNGRVPFSELVFPVEKATGGSSGGDGFTVDSQYFVQGAGTVLATINDRTYVKVSDGGAATALIVNYSVPYSGGATVFLASTIPVDAEYSPSSGISYIVYENVTVYYTFNYGYWNNPQYSSNIPVLDFGGGTYDIESILRRMNFDVSGSGGRSSIPVQWKSPYDGRTFEDAFEITVTPSGSGYSDDSGGSESGGGGNIDSGGGSGFSDDSGGSESGGGGNF